MLKVHQQRNGDQQMSTMHLHWGSREAQHPWALLWWCAAQELAHQDRVRVVAPVDMEEGDCVRQATKD